MLILFRNLLLHLLKDRVKAKQLTSEAQLNNAPSRSKAIIKKVENIISLNLKEKVTKYNFYLHNLQDGFNKSLVFICFSDTGGYTREEFFDPRETPYVPINSPKPSSHQGRAKTQAHGRGGASNAGRPPASSGKQFFANERRERGRVEVTEGLTPNLRV